MPTQTLELHLPTFNIIRYFCCIKEVVNEQKRYLPVDELEPSSPVARTLWMMSRWYHDGVKCFESEQNDVTVSLT